MIGTGGQSVVVPGGFESVGADTNNGGIIFHGANITLSSNAGFLWFWNNAHPGGGEFQMQSPNFFIGPQNGGHLQMCLGSDARDIMFMQWASDPANFGYSHIFGWRYNWATNTIIARWDSEASNYDNVIGNSLPNFWVDTTNNWTTDTDLTHSKKVFSLDSKGSGNTVLHGGETYDVLSSSPGATYNIDFTTNRYNTLNLVQAETFALVNVALTNQAHPVDLYIYPGLNQKQVTFPAGPIWESESGLAVAPTNIPASNVLHVTMTAFYGTTTNSFTPYALAPYVPVLDTNASNFFTLANITAANEKDAINNLVLEMKAAGIFTNAFDFVYPVCGSTSNSTKWNLVATNLFPVTWNIPASIVFGTQGVYGNGGTTWGDTGFNPSSATSPNFVQNSACLGFYSKFNVGYTNGGGRTGNGQSTIDANFLADTKD